MIMPRQKTYSALDSLRQICRVSLNVATVVLQKRAHGQCTLPWAQTGEWTDVRTINIVYSKR